MSAQHWIDPYAGFVYAEDHITIETDYQQEKLSACGIDPGIFADQADPSFFIGFAIHAGIKSGITAQGNINMLQSLTQHRPVLLGEALTVNGEIADVKVVPRGRTLHTEVRFEDAQGNVVITANRVSLKPDPQKVGTRGAGEKPAPAVLEPQSLLRGNTYQLTPDGVKAYSSEGNSIHYEEAAAIKAGFRAPLIGGGMGVHYLMAALWKQKWKQTWKQKWDQQRPPQSFQADIYFRRPIFWDEAVTVAMDVAGQPNLMALLKPDDKVGTEMRLRQVIPQAQS